MSDVTDLVTELRARQIRLWVEGEKLRYRAPQGALTDEVRRELKARRSELLRVLADVNSAEAHGEREPLTPDPANRFEPFPLTDLQQAYWLGRIGAIDVASVACHAYSEVDLDSFDPDRFSNAIGKLVDRHEMLRCIINEDGQQQILEKVPPYRVPIVDCRSLPEHETEQTLSETRDQLSHQILPTDRWPLFEFRATRIEGERTRLHISVDLLLADVLSIQLIQHDLGRFYREPDLELPAPELSFRDCVLAEAAHRRSPEYARARAYWEERVDALPEAPQLPMQRPMSALERVEFERRSSGLGKEDWDAFQRNCEAAGVTTSSALLTAFGQVIATWSRHPRFLINVPLFNRPQIHDEIDAIVGDFTSVDLLEVDYSNSAPFETHARNVQAQLLSDLEHMEFGGLGVAREMNLRRGTAPGALPWVVFTNQVGERARRAAGSAAAGTIVFTVSQTPQVCLDHQVFEEDGCLRFNWDTVQNLFEPGVIDALFDAYCARLQALATPENWSASDSELIPTAQLAARRAVNATQTTAPEGLLADALPPMARALPSAPAVFDSEGVLDYRSLDERARVLARELRARGVEAEQPVAIVCDRSREQIVAATGVVLSGGMYVPIQPDTPPARVATLLREAGVRIGVCSAPCAPLLGSVETLVLGTEPRPPAQEVELPRANSPGDLAYVIYTSGSTGTPKGVMIEHRAALNTIEDINRQLRLEPSDRLLGLSAMSFDLSVYDVFGAQRAGAAVVIPDAEASRDPSRWIDLIQAHRVTVWNSVPALMQLLVEEAEAQSLQLPTIRAVLLSGDWIPIDLPARIAAVMPNAEVTSLGGATEASIWSISYPIARGEAFGASVPYGRPLANQACHVLDERMQHRPDRVIGDLYIEGRGLARGYYRDTAKTEASFRVHPVSGAMLYRTGDLARYRPDGVIELIGREDGQVKIHGHRIELGDVEAALLAHEAVGQCAAIVHDASPTRRQLVAYVTGNGVALSEELSFTDRLPPMGEFPPAQLEDEVDKLDFKSRRPGLRRDLGLRSKRLPRPELTEAFAAEHLRRASERTFSDEPISLESLGDWLANLLQLEVADRPFPKARYPSAGDLFPVQTYLHCKAGAIEGLDEGLYHYDPARHRLDEVAVPYSMTARHQWPGNDVIFDAGSFSVFLIGRMAAMRPLYGDLGLELALVEAGCVAQLLMTAAPASGIGVCPIGSGNFEAIRDAFQLDPGDRLLHSLIGGRSARSLGPATPLEQARPLDAESVRAHCRTLLPEYMVPARVLCVPSLPLTANGKLDRGGLQRLAQPEQEVFIGPGSDAEEAIARIVAEALGVDRVSVDRNFFELGASSVDLLRIHRRLRETIAPELTVVDLFRSPNTRALARLGAEDPQSDAVVSSASDRAQRQREGLRRAASRSQEKR